MEIEEGKLIDKNQFVSLSLMSGGRYRVSVIDPDLYAAMAAHIQYATYISSDSEYDIIPNVVYSNSKEIAGFCFGCTLIFLVIRERNVIKRD